MIFKETATWVLGVSPHTGKPKTQTRRPAGPHAAHVELSAQGRTVITHVYDGTRLRYRRSEIAVQPGRGKHQVGRARITAIRYCERTRDISVEDAIAEGFASPDDFRAIWRKLYGEASLDEPCYALELEVVR